MVEQVPVAPVAAPVVEQVAPAAPVVQQPVMTGVVTQPVAQVQPVVPTPAPAPAVEESDGWEDLMRIFGRGRNH